MDALLHALIQLTLVRLPSSPDNAPAKRHVAEEVRKAADLFSVFDEGDGEQDRKLIEELRRWDEEAIRTLSFLTAFERCDIEGGVFLEAPPPGKAAVEVNSKDLTPEQRESFRGADAKE